MNRIEYVKATGYHAYAEPIKLKFFSYVVNGRPVNKGDTCELLVKIYFGVDPVKDITMWRNGSDLNDLRISVKSPKASLCDDLRGDVDSQINAYCAGCHCTSVIWADFDGDTLEMWRMDMDTFKRFTKRFGRVSTDGKLHYPTTSAMMRAWFKAN